MAKTTMRAKPKPHVLTALREQIRTVLNDYRDCKIDYAWEWESKFTPISEEIAKRVVDNYMILAGRKIRPVEFQAAVAEYLADEAKVERDPWAMCRTEAARIAAEGEIVRLCGRFA